MEKEIILNPESSISELFPMMDFNTKGAYLVEGQNSKRNVLYSGGEKYHCDCTTSSLCEHILLLKKYQGRHSKRAAYYEFVSALHKSIRSKNYIDCIYWMRALLSAGFKVSTILNYIKLINLEESSNFKLQADLEQAHSEDLFKMLLRVCSSIKKNELFLEAPLQNLWAKSTLLVANVDGNEGSDAYLKKVMESGSKFHIMTLFNYSKLRSQFFKILQVNGRFGDWELLDELHWVLSFEMKNPFYKAFHLQLALIVDKYDIKCKGKKIDAKTLWKSNQRNIIIPSDQWNTQPKDIYVAVRVSQEIDDNQVSRSVQNSCKGQLTEIESLMENSELTEPQLKNLTAQIEPILLEIVKSKSFDIDMLGYEMRNSNKWISDSSVLCREYPCKSMPVTQLRDCSELLTLFTKTQ